jgi:thiazolinyl imide reductase
VTRDRFRVIVCGATFGQVYLEGVAAAGPPIELAGVLARGSPRAEACAAHYRVPLYRRVADLPDDVDAACVVVRAGLLGGEGSTIARALMSRGIHVLQEHPLHHDELAECLRAARRHGVIYRLNSFYVDVEPVQRFVAAGRALLLRQQPVYLDAACGFQLLYSLLDIIGELLGRVRPWSVAVARAADDPAAASAGMPAFRSLDGSIGRVPLTLRVQNQLDASDPDNFAHLMHRITIGARGGNLTLLNTHGPLVWSARPHFPTAVRDAASRPHFERRDRSGDGVPSADVLGPPQSPPFDEIFGRLWPEAVARAVRRLHDHALVGANPLTGGQYHLSLCRLWQEIGERLGPPELLRMPAVQAFTSEDVAAVAAAADVRTA